MTVSGIVTVLKLNQETARDWIDSGRSLAFRRGRRVRAPRSDFDRLIQDGSIVVLMSHGRRIPSPTIWHRHCGPPKRQRRRVRDAS